MTIICYYCVVLKFNQLTTLFCNVVILPNCVIYQNDQKSDSYLLKHKAMAIHMQLLIATLVI